ncbi:MAG: thioredoxin domain-containing protein [Pseudomonadota bacterium]
MNKVAAIISVVLALMVGYFLGRHTSGKSDTTVSNSSTAGMTIERLEEELGPGNPQSERMRVVVTPSDPGFGPANALVTLVEFSDFECPFCSRGASVVQQIKGAYPNQVRVVFKQSPLPFHKNAVPAAEAVLAAHEQGKFWQMHDKLFANQKALDRASLERYAGEIGLDLKKFKDALDTHKFKAKIDSEMAQAQRVGARGTPNFFVNGKQLTGAKPFEEFKKAIDDEIAFAQKLMAEKKIAANVLYRELMKDAKRPSAVAAAQPNQPGERPPRPAAPDPTKTYKVEVGSSPVKGKPTAKLTVIIFSDFECPFCSKVEVTLSDLEKKYGNDIRFVWKNQPLPFHKNATPAAEASLAAGEQGKFWQMHDKLFANQKALDRASLEGYASQLGLDLARFKAALDSGKHKGAIEADRKQALQFGVRGTPAFFVNGRFLSGAQPLENFVKLCDEELAKANTLGAKGIRGEKLYDEIIKNGETEVKAAQAQAPNQPSGPDPNAVYKIEVAATDPQQGPATAKVTIVLFSDFECPFCSRIAAPLEEAMKRYAGDLRVVFKNFPLPFHKNATGAAEAALAAHEQGKFWQMHNEMFANQKALDRPALEGYATKIGLNMAKFKAALDGQKLKPAVDKDLQVARQFGVGGTPSFYINGRPFRGQVGTEPFEARIKEEIAKADELLKKGAKPKDLYATIIKDGQTSVAMAPMQQRPPADNTVYDVKPGDSPAMGDPRAPVTIVEFSDFECPFCSRGANTMTELAKLYGKNVRIVFKQHPLDFHQNAKVAAQAALAAHEQGKFWEMHDKMFANQRSLSRESLEGFAKEIGLDVNKFKTALDSPKIAAALAADLKQAEAIGVSGTPAFFINGRKFAGALPIDQFKTVVDEELAKAKGGAKPTQAAAGR